MFDFLLENNVITKNQSAFRKLYSTITSLICSTDFWYENIDSKKLNLTIFLDLKKAFDKVIGYADKVEMSIYDQFCVERNRPNFLNLVKNKLDITFANEQEITSLIKAKNFAEVINFSKLLNKLLIITRGEKGAIAINGDEVVEIDIQKNLKIIDLTGAGDLFAAGFLHGYINKLSTKECLKKGTEMSSKVIQQIGARL